MPACKPYFKLRERRVVPHVPSDARPWTVPDLCTAYDWPTGLAGGGVIAIVELGGGWIQSDMDAFFSSIGQPLPQITDIETIDGTKNTPNQQPIDVPKRPNPDVEVALDIQVAAAGYYVATGKPATIKVYWAQDIAAAVGALLRMVATFARSRGGPTKRFGTRSRGPRRPWRPPPKQPPRPG